MVQWQKPSDVEFLGAEDAAAALDACSMALMAGDWNGIGYFRHRLSDGRACWLRRAYLAPDAVYAAFIAPWDSLFDTDVVSDSAMVETYKPEGWRTKALNGIRTYQALSDDEKSARQIAAAEKRNARAAEKAAAREAREAARAEAREAKAREAIGTFWVGEVAAIDAKGAGAFLCRVVALDDDGLPSRAEIGATRREVSKPVLDAQFIKGWKWRALAKWPLGREDMWRRRKMAAKTFWALTCQLGMAENAERLKE